MMSNKRSYPYFLNQATDSLTGYPVDPLLDQFLEEPVPQSVETASTVLEDPSLISVSFARLDTREGK